MLDEQQLMLAGKYLGLPEAYVRNIIAAAKLGNEVSLNDARVIIEHAYALGLPRPSEPKH